MSWLLLLFAMTPPVSPPAVGPPSSPFDDPVTVLVPRTPRSQELERRVTSAALYAEARLHYRRHEFDHALRRLQRAWRYHPQASGLLREILALASDLRRTDEALRYALIAADTIDLDQLLLRRLAAHASSRQQWEQALRLYRIALEQNPPPDGESLEVGDALLYFDMGRISFLLEDYASASDYFARIQRFLEDPKQLSDDVTLQTMLLGQADQTYLLLAESYLADGRLDAAAAMFRKADEADEQESLVDYHLARVDAKRDAAEDALPRLERYLQATGAQAPSEAYELLADLLSRLHEEQAESMLLARLEPLAAEDGAGGALLQFLAEYQASHQRWDEAERWYVRALDAEPAVEPLAGLAEIQGRQRQVAGLLDTLARAAAEGILLDDLSELRQELTDSPEEKFVDELIAEAQRRVDADREHVALTGLPLAAADLAIHTGRYEVAEALFDLAWQWKQPEVRSRALLRWGVELLLAGEYPRAAALFRRGIDEQLVDQRADVAHFYLVRALALAGEHDEALEAAEAAAALFPDALRLQSLPAWVLYRARRYDRALPRYQAVLQRFDGIHDNPIVRDEMRDIRLSLSHVCVQRDEIDAAGEWLEQVLDEFPEDAGALNDLGYLWTEQGKNLNWALQMIRSAVEQDPENVAYLDSLGWVYFQLERYEEAVQWLEKAAAGDATDGVILDHLGDAYWKTGQRENALQAWQRAVQGFDEDGEISKRDATKNKIKRHEHSGK